MIGHFGLLHEMLLQGGFRRQGVEKMLPAFFIFSGALPHTAGVRHVIAPVLADFFEHLEILGEIHFFPGVVIRG